MMLFRLLGLLVVFTCSAALAEYAPPDYPRPAAVVSSLSVSAPVAVGQGSTLVFDVQVGYAGGTSKDKPLLVYLVKDGSAWQVAKYKLPASASNTLMARNLKMSVPANIPPGDYVLEASVLSEDAVATTKVKVTGKQPSRLGKIVTRGEFRDKYNIPHRWYINQAHTLIWDGEPYIPMGGMFIYNRDWNIVKSQIDLMVQYGVRDIYLHLGVNQPYPWKTYSDDDYKFFQQTIDYLDEKGIRYGIQFQAIELKGPGYYYPGRGPRFEITDSKKIEFVENKSRGGYWMVYDRKTGKEVSKGKVSVTEEKNVAADVVVPRPGDYRVIFALEKNEQDGSVMYYWDNRYDEYLQIVKRHYSKVKLGSGFRFLVDPLWNEMNQNRDYFPNAPRYQKWQADFLKKRYGTIEALNKAWRTQLGQIKDFEQAGRVFAFDRIKDPVELASLPKGKDEILTEYQWLMDPQNMQTFRLPLTKTQYNYDVQECLGRGLLHYTSDIADFWKELNDVPVIYKGFTDMDFWHINDLGTHKGHDGLGMESYGNGEPMMLFMAGHLFGELEQATKTTWLIVTETAEGNHQDNSPSRNKMPGYTSRVGHMYANINALIAGGAKGFFHYNMVPSDGSNDPWTDGLTADVRQLEWLGTYGRAVESAADGLVDYKPTAYFRFPGLYNPNSMSLHSEPVGDYYNLGGWWWREPIGKSANGIWILPSFSLRPETPLHIVNLENHPATERHHDEFTKAVKDGVRIALIGFRKDLGSLPIVDNYFTNRYGTDTDGRKFQVLKPPKGAKILGKTASGEVWNFRLGNLQVISKEVFGQHGYQPVGLDVTEKEQIDAYWGIFDKIGVKVRNLEGAVLMQYNEGKDPVTVVQVTDKPRSLIVKVPQGSDWSAQWSNGEAAGSVENNTLRVDLKPVDRKLIRRDDWAMKDQVQWLRNGILVDTTKAMDSVILKGIPHQSFASLQLPAKAIDPARTVWIEAENYARSNFNYSKMSGITPCSGEAIIALQAEVKPPADTGYFANYRFNVPADGLYQFWVRENYLSYSSPSDWKIGNNPWVAGTNRIVPQDTQMVALYNALEDTRQVFAWYHYGAVPLKKGENILQVRVRGERGKGMAVTMADERQYAKLIDCFVLTRDGFMPDGATGTVDFTDSHAKPLINLVQNPSFEFRPKEGMKIPSGWTPSEESDKVRWQDAGWGAYNVMPGLDINLGQRFSYVGQRNLTIEAGDIARSWKSSAIPVAKDALYLADAHLRVVRLETGEATVRLEWLDAARNIVGTSALGSLKGDQDWTKLQVKESAPSSAVSARFVFEVTPGAGVAFFDDIALAKIEDQPRN